MIRLFHAEPARRSVGVSIIAWLAMLFGGIGALAGVSQLLTAPSWRSLGLLAGGVCAAVAGVGLRRRRNWARLSIIGVQSLAIVESFARAVRLPAQVPPSLLSGLTNADVAAAVRSLRSVLLTVAVVFAIVNGLVMLKLCSRRVRVEFDAM